MARGWTQVETVKNLTTAGIPTAQSVYSEWESGTRIPAERNLAKLEAFFGPMSESPGVGDTQPGLSLLFEKLDRQAELLTEYIEVTRDLVRLAAGPERQGQPPPAESGPEARKILKRSAERAETEEPPALSQSVSPIPIRSAQRG